MAALSALFPLVAPHTPGVAELAVENAVRQAAIEFCHGTLALQRTLEPAITQAGVFEYDFEIGSQEVVVRLLSATFGGTPLRIGRPEDIDARPMAQVGVPALAYTPDGSRRIELHPAPASAGVPVIVRVALRPSQAATRIDDSLYERHAQALAHGAVALLAAQPNKSYSDPVLASTMRQAFTDAVARAKRDTFYANARSSPRVDPMYF